ncbi:MAG: hypothetical protein HZB09_02740 [Candidatus Yonathbacteria bacterium]|nr:hypothetical protein [Candidatus Yonathbacteria bacterium]
MNPEKPKQYTPEEIAEMEKSRTISDAELLKGGAKHMVGGDGNKRLEVSDLQLKTLINREERKNRINEINAKIENLERALNRLEYLQKEDVTPCRDSNLPDAGWEVVIGGRFSQYDRDFFPEERHIEISDLVELEDLIKDNSTDGLILRKLIGQKKLTDEDLELLKEKFRDPLRREVAILEQERNKLFDHREKINPKGVS